MNMRPSLESLIGSEPNRLPIASAAVAAETFCTLTGRNSIIFGSVSCTVFSIGPRL